MVHPPSLLTPEQQALFAGLTEQHLAKPHAERWGYAFAQPMGQALGIVIGADPQLRALEADLYDLADAGLIRIQSQRSGTIDQFAITNPGLAFYNQWRAQRVGQPAALEDLETSDAVYDVPEMIQHVTRIRASLHQDPAQAIGSAKELLESVCKTILGLHGTGSTDDLPLLIKRVRQQLDLESGSTGNARDRVLNGLTQIATGVSELRNLQGTGHGRSKAPNADPTYARLAVDSASAIALFLLDSWKHQSCLR